MSSRPPPAFLAGGKKIGYARVSREDQNLALQLDALNAAGCSKIFHDEGISGAVLARPALSKALASLEVGDSLITWRLDRLGRSLAHLIDIMTELSERGIGFRSTYGVSPITLERALKRRPLAADGGLGAGD